MTVLTKIPGIGKKMAQHLINAGYPDIESLKGQNPEEIYTKHCLIQGVGNQSCRCVLYCYRLAVYSPAMTGNCRPIRKTGTIGRTEIMEDISIRLITKNKKDFLPLLLLGDEQESHIDKYLERGDMFALYVADLKSICVVTDEGGGILEIQNLATDKRYQRQGYASRLIDYVAGYYAGRYDKIILGTGDVPGILTFYERCGFVITHRIPDYFTINYDHPIIEDGVLLKDQVYLERKILT